MKLIIGLLAALLVCVIAILLLTLSLSTSGAAKAKTRPGAALPQGWHIVYQRTNNNIPESLVYLTNNQMQFRFAVDFRTNLVTQTKAVRQ